MFATPADEILAEAVFGRRPSGGGANAFFTEPDALLDNLDRNTNGNLVLQGNGVTLTVDQSLLLDAQGGDALIGDGTRFVAPGGSQIEVRGQNITVSGLEVDQGADSTATFIAQGDLTFDFGFSRQETLVPALALTGNGAFNLDLQAGGAIAIRGDIETDAGTFLADAGQGGFRLEGLVDTGGGAINIRSAQDVALLSAGFNIGDSGLDSEGGRITIDSTGGQISTRGVTAAELSTFSGSIRVGTGELLLRSQQDQTVDVESAGKIAAQASAGSIDLTLGSFGALAPQAFAIGRVENPDFFGAPLALAGLSAADAFDIVAEGGVRFVDDIALVSSSFSRVLAGDLGAQANRIVVQPGASVAVRDASAPQAGSLQFVGRFTNIGALLVEDGQLQLTGPVHENRGSIELAAGSSLRFWDAPDGLIQPADFVLRSGSLLSGNGLLDGGGLLGNVEFPTDVIGQLTQESGSEVSPGAGDGRRSVGTLSVQNLAWTVADGTRFSFDIGSATNDRGGTIASADRIRFLDEPGRSSLRFGAQGPTVVMSLVDPLNPPPPSGTPLVLITADPTAPGGAPIDFAVLNANAVLQDRILGELLPGSVAFSFAGLQPDPSPDPPQTPNPPPTPDRPPTPEPRPDPLPPQPEPEPKPSPPLQTFTNLEQPIIPPAQTSPELASEETPRERKGRASLTDGLKVSDIAFRSPFLDLLERENQPPKDEGPLVILVESLRDDPMLEQLKAVEQTRTLDVQATLPNVERPKDAPEELSSEDIKAALEAARRVVRAAAPATAPAAGGTP